MLRRLLSPVLAAALVLPASPASYAFAEDDDGALTTLTSRTLGVLGEADTIAEAEAIAEAALQHIQGDLIVRHDIGKAQLIERRIHHMRQVRGA